LELSHKMLNLNVYRSKSLLTNVRLIDTIELFPCHINANCSGGNLTSTYATTCVRDVSMPNQQTETN